MSAQSQAVFAFSNNPVKPSNVRGPRAPRIIGRGDGWAFWRIGTEVYRAADGAELDTFGHPMGKRWECSAATWVLYRESVFAWVEDVE